MPVPDIHAGGYLLSALNKIRPTRPMPMGGQRAIDWPEIEPFAVATGLVSEPWEKQALYDMASAYVTGLVEGANPLSIAPIDRDNTGEDEE